MRIYIYNTSSSKIPSEPMWQYLIPLEERDVYKLVKFQVVNEDTGGQCLRPSYHFKILRHLFAPGIPLNLQTTGPTAGQRV